MIFQKLSRILIVSGAIFGGNSLTFAEDLQISEIRWTADRPLYSQHVWQKNLLRHHVGSRVVGEGSSTWQIDAALNEASENPRALISDDPTIPMVVRAGETNLEYSLGQRFLLRRVTFMNEGASGTVQLSTAATDPSKPNGRWVTIATREVDSTSREHEIKFAAVDCRYVRLKFVAKTPGKVYGLGVFGIRKAVEFYDPGETRIRADLVESAGDAEDDYVDLAEPAPRVPADAFDAGVTNGLGWSHIEMVSSAQTTDVSTTSRMLDEDSTSGFRFSENDMSPTVVVDLGRRCDCGRVSVIYSTGERGTMSMWLGDVRTDVPTADVQRGVEDFGLGADRIRVKLKRTVEDRMGIGRVSFDRFRREGRYLVLRWDRDARLPTRPTEPSGFEISELAVFEHRGGTEIVTRTTDLREIVIDDVRPRPVTRERDFKVPLFREPITINEPPVSR